MMNPVLHQIKPCRDALAWRLYG